LRHLRPILKLEKSQTEIVGRQTSCRDAVSPTSESDFLKYAPWVKFQKPFKQTTLKDYFGSAEVSSDRRLLDVSHRVGESQNSVVNNIMFFWGSPTLMTEGFSKESKHHSGKWFMRKIDSYSDSKLYNWVWLFIKITRCGRKTILKGLWVQMIRA
jgi:hypothetical protein